MINILTESKDTLNSMIDEIKAEDNRSECVSKVINRIQKAIVCIDIAVKELKKGGNE